MDLLTYYKKVIALRNNYTAFQKGDWVTLWAKGDVFAFLRGYQEEVFVVVLNRHQTAEQKVTLELSQEYQGIWKEIFPQEKERQKKSKTLDVTLRPLEGKVFTKVK